MTSESDSKRRPPTIELKATEIEKPASATEPAGTERQAERAAEADSPSQKSPNPGAASPQPDPAPQSATDRSSGGRLKSHAPGALIGAMVVAAIAAGLWIAGLVPSRETAAPANTSSSGAPPPSAAPTDAAISARLDKIEHAIAAPRPESALTNRMAAAEAQMKSLGDSLAALTRRLDDIAAISQRAAKQADAAQAATDAAKSASQAGANQDNIQRGDIDALANRIAALETAVKALADAAAHPAAGTSDQAARLTISAEALRAAVERGAPYQSELAAVQSLGVDRNATAPLEPFAASGVPSAGALAHELATLVPALQQASVTTPSETDFLHRLEANARNLVRITPIDAPIGNDPSSVIGRIGVDAARADIAAAMNDIAALPDAARPLAADWVKKVQARDAAIAASRQIAADALAALTKPAAQ